MSSQHHVRPRHLRPTAELAERVLLPDDPARALAVAQHLLERPPRMFNHARGLWGYTGVAADGLPLTVQATGIGGPSAAIVCEELIALGATTLIRIGTCAALDHDLAPGELIAAEAVLPGDGASAALGAYGALRPDPGLHARLLEAGARAATVASSDLFYDPRAGAASGRRDAGAASGRREGDAAGGRREGGAASGRREGDAAGGWLEAGARAVELEAAAVLQVAALRGAAAACVLAVSDSGGAAGEPAAGDLDPDALEKLALRAGAAAFEALRSR